MIKAMVAIALAAVGLISTANAQSFPSRPVTLLVPLAPGGSTDTIARIIAEGMRPHLGQPVIVENSPGAGGTTGVIRAARSTPDGYIVQIGQWGTNVASGAVYDLPIDLLKDLEPVGLICTQPSMIVGRKNLPADNLKQLIAWIKANPGKVTVGNAGIGSPGHVGGVFFQNTIGAQMQFIPYRSAGPASQDMLAGNIDLMMDTAATSGGYVRSGLLKAFAMAANKRSPVMPDVPTDGRGGAAGILFLLLARAVGAEGHAEGCHRQAQRCAGKARNDPATHKRLADAGQEFFPRRHERAGGARQIPESKRSTSGGRSSRPPA